MTHFTECVPLPTASRQLGSARKEFRRRLPHGSDAGKRRFSAAPCPKVVGHGTEQVLPPTIPRHSRNLFHYPHPLGIVAMHCRTQGMWHCAARVPLPDAPKCCGSVLREFHRPPPQGREGVCRRNSTSLRPNAVVLHHLNRTRVNIRGGSLGYHGQAAENLEYTATLQQSHGPLPPSKQALCSRSSTAHCPRAVERKNPHRPLPGTVQHSPLPTAHCVVVVRHIAGLLGASGQSSSCYITCACRGAAGHGTVVAHCWIA